LGSEDSKFVCRLSVFQWRVGKCDSRTSMTLRDSAFLWAAIIGCTGCSTPGPEAYTKGGLVWHVWVEKHKGFRQPAYYVGSIDDESFFTAGKFSHDRYREKTSTLNLPRTFPFGKGTPYQVTEEMAPR
jgi:hypothetical protein